MRIISASKLAAAQDRVTLAAKELRDAKEAAEKRDAAHLATIERLRAELDQQRDRKPDGPVQHPKASAGDAELQRRLNLALRRGDELQQRLDELQASNDAASRELQDLRRGWRRDHGAPLRPSGRRPNGRHRKPTEPVPPQAEPVPHEDSTDAPEPTGVRDE